MRRPIKAHLINRSTGPNSKFKFEFKKIKNFKTGHPVRSNRPVRSGSGLGRYQTGPNSKFNFEFKNEKFPKKS